LLLSEESVIQTATRRSIGSHLNVTERRYLVKEMFGPTLQGEGAHAGRACIFLRFAACNLDCPGCDTDLSPEGAVRRDASEIVARLQELDRGGSGRVIVTGGEPTLQWDAALSAAIRGAGFRVHMESTESNESTESTESTESNESTESTESNGTRVPAGAVDWLTISHKIVGIP
jgi:organic radical activating enzyme